MANKIRKRIPTLCPTDDKDYYEIRARIITRSKEFISSQLLGVMRWDDITKRWAVTRYRHKLTMYISNEYLTQPKLIAFFNKVYHN